MLTLGSHSYAGEGVCNTPTSVGHYTSIACGVQFRERIQHPCIANPRLVSTAARGNLPGYPDADVVGGIAVGSDVWIGEHAVMFAPVTIGHGAIIGAFSVVAKDVPPYAVVVGNPARTIRYRFDAPTVAALLRIAWWEWSDDLIAERAADLRDVRVLIAKHDWPDL